MSSNINIKNKKFINRYVIKNPSRFISIITTAVVVISAIGMAIILDVLKPQTNSSASEEKEGLLYTEEKTEYENVDAVETYLAKIEHQKMLLDSMENNDEDEYIVDLNDKDLYILEAVVYGEAAGEPMEGKIAVAAVVLNRLKDSRFPNTIKEIVYQDKQFSCVWSVKSLFHIYTGNKEVEEAVKRALKGEDPTNGALYFCNPKYSKKEALKWFATLEYICTIGNHNFYK